MRDGRLRTLWRFLTFVVLFLAIIQLELLFLPALMPVSAAGEVRTGLIVQAVIVLTAALAAAWPLLRWADRRPWSWLGVGIDRRLPGRLGAGLLIGAGPLALVVGVLAVAGAFRYVAEPGTPGGWIATAGMGLAWLALPAASEEALFRGYPLRTLADGAGPVVATVVMSALFALVHAANPNVDGFALVNIFLAGVLLSAAVLWTGSLWLAFAIHLGWNWAIAALLDLPVSGLATLDAPYYDAHAVGPAWVTGGAFGPEGGIAATIAILLAVALLRIYTRRGDEAAAPENGR